jgi:hypothetical protein
MRAGHRAIFEFSLSTPKRNFLSLRRVAAPLSGRGTMQE